MRRVRVDRALVVAAIVAAADLLTKWAAFGGGEDGVTRTFIPGVEIDPTRNEGVAFSMLEGQTFLIFGLITIAIVLLTGFYLRHRDRPGLWLAIGLMLGGAAGNAIDRVTLGYVRDFISIGSWPTFNVADVSLAAGVLTLLVVQWQAEAGEPEAPADDETKDRADNSV
jgi:signal peptidase II